jgi:hypothetical protein
VFIARDPEMNQYFRQLVPNIGPIDINIMDCFGTFLKSVRTLVLIHSGDGLAYRTKNQNVKVDSVRTGKRLRFLEGEVPPMQWSMALSRLLQVLCRF